MRCRICRDNECPGCDIDLDDGYEPDYDAILDDRDYVPDHQLDWPEPVGPTGVSIR